MLILDHVYFFFQAEDGIRDPLVTGVQTCALPISRSPQPPSPQTSFVPVAPTSGERRKSTSSVVGSGFSIVTCSPLRSEERRVGKESRRRGAGQNGERAMRYKSGGRADACERRRER